MKKFLKPVLVLVLICIVGTGLLAMVNSITSPIITLAEEKKENDALKEVFPGASGFTMLENLNGMPDTVTTIYEENQGLGYVFKLETAGYAQGIKILCAIGKDRSIIRCVTISSNETDGYGKNCESTQYTNQYTGKAEDLRGVDAISGATKTSNAYKNAILDAFQAFDLLKGGEQ